MNLMGRAMSFLIFASAVCIIFFAGNCTAGLLDIVDQVEKSGGKSGTLRGGGDDAANAEELEYDLESALGDHISLEGFRRYGLPVDDPDLQRYVNLVGNSLVRQSDRADIPFYFVVVESSLYSSFASTGGIVFITSEFMKSMKNESELAGVLAHEISHINRKHLLQSASRAGLGGEMPFEEIMSKFYSILFSRGLESDLEFEADQLGMNIVYGTGYDPGGFISAMKTLQNVRGAAKKEGAWFSTHPPLAERIRKCRIHLKYISDISMEESAGDRFSEYKNRLLEAVPK